MSLIEKMSTDLQLSTPAISKIAATASHRYKSYELSKRGGGKRHIFHPAKELKGLQRWLLTQVIADLPVHDAATAYKPGSSIKKNAEPHGPFAYTLALDIERFFESFTQPVIGAYLAGSHRTASWSPDDVDLFLRLVCRFGNLTIGAPTSPALSNVLFHDFDVAVSAACKARAVMYTRYADDMFFSADDSARLADITGMIDGQLISSFGGGVFALTGAKTRWMSRKGHRRITGLVVGSRGEVGLGRERKRMLKACIHKYSGLNAHQKTWLAGMLAFVRAVEPTFIDRLVLKYGWEAVERARTGG